MKTQAKKTAVLLALCTIFASAVSVAQAHGGGHGGGASHASMSRPSVMRSYAALSHTNVVKMNSSNSMLNKFNTAKLPVNTLKPITMQPTFPSHPIGTLGGVPVHPTSGGTLNPIKLPPGLITSIGGVQLPPTTTTPPVKLPPGIITGLGGGVQLPPTTTTPPVKTPPFKLPPGLITNVGGLPLSPPSPPATTTPPVTTPPAPTCPTGTRGWGGIGFPFLPPFLGGFGGGYGSGYGNGGYAGSSSASPVASLPVADATVAQVAAAAPAAAAAKPDLEVVAVQAVDNGDAADLIGPRYRVMVRNNSSVNVNQEFSVSLSAGNDQNPSSPMLSNTRKVKGLNGGETTLVDIRLPYGVNQMGADAQGRPATFSYLVVTADSQREVDDANRANNTAAIAHDAVPTLVASAQ